MHVAAVLKASMKLHSSVAVAAVSVVALLACPRKLLAQSIPDIVWQTNAHGGKVWSVAFSGDGGTLASGSEDLTAKVWTVPGGGLVRTVTTPHAKVIAVALHTPGDNLLTGGDDGAVREWAIGSGNLLWGGSPNDDIIWSVAISPNGSTTAGGRSCGLIGIVGSDGSDGYHFEGHGGDVYSVTFSPDGSKLASASKDGTAKIWLVMDGTILQTLTGHSFLSTNEDDIVINAVADVDFSPDGTLLLTTGADSTARLWRVSDGIQVAVLEGGGGNAAKFSSDGKTLFTVTNGRINFWRVADGRLLAAYDAGAGPLAVAPSGKYFAYGRGDGAVVLARVPLWIESITQAQGRVALSWHGGSGRYQVQARRHSDKGHWHNLGVPTTKTTLTRSCSSRQLFYRVLSLPNP